MRRCCLIFILLCAESVSQAQALPSPDPVFEAAYPERVFRMEAWFRQVFRQPDGTLKVLTQAQRHQAFRFFKEAAAKQGDRKADLYARIVEWGQDLRDRPPQSDIAESKTASLVREAGALDFHVAAAQAEQNLAFSFGRQKDPGKEIFHLLQAYSHYKDLDFGVYPFRKYALYTLALHFYRVEEYAEARQYGLLADVAGDTARLNVLFVKTLLGLTYIKTGKPDSALIFFSDCQPIASGLRKSAWPGICTGNRALALAELGRTAEALAGLDSGTQTCLLHADTLNALQFALARGKLLKGLGQWPEDEYFDAFLPALISVCRNTDVRLDWFRLLAAWQTHKGMPARALQSKDSVLHYTALLTRERGLKESARAQLAFAQEQYRAIEEKALYQSRIQQWKWISLLAGLLALSGFALWMLNRKKQLAERRSFQAERAQTRTHAALDAAEHRLREFMRTVAEKNQEITSLRAEGYSDPERDASLGLLRRAAILTEDDWLRFADLFDQVYPGYLSSLRRQTPSLTRAELRYLALQRLELSTREMAQMLGVGEEAIRSVRSRLRKKTPDQG
jgi:hypothetical protein